MKDYIDKINREMESSSKAQESAWAMGTRLKPRINEKRVDSSVQLEASMPCFFFTDFIADRMIATQLDLLRLMRDDDTVNDTVNDTEKMRIPLSCPKQNKRYSMLLVRIPTTLMNSWRQFAVSLVQPLPEQSSHYKSITASVVLVLIRPDIGK